MCLAVPGKIIEIYEKQELKMARDRRSLGSYDTQLR